MISRLYLMPTHKCNCGCTYCYIPHSERDKQIGYTFLEDTVYQFIDEIKTYKLENQAEIRFIGGEPYLETETISRLSNLFLNSVSGAKVIINSNGTLITENRLKKFNINNLDSLIHILSLDGTEEIHNKRRKLNNKKNAFIAVIEAIRLLQQMNLPVYLNMVLDEYTLSGLEGFMKYLNNQLNINKLSVSLLFKPGAIVDVKTKFDLLEQVYSYAAKNKVLIGGHHRLLGGSEIPEFRCRAGEKTLLLSGDQRIYACQRFVGREEAELFTKELRFVDISCGSCVNKNCYSIENQQLGKKIIELYKSKYPEYLRVNEFDRILFGVL